MKKIDISFCSTLEDAVNELLRRRANGEQVYCIFNDVKLYSDNVTMDSAYMEVCGCTKEEHDRRMEEYIDNIKKERARDQAEALKKVPMYINKGKELIYPFRLKEWEEFVIADATGTYNGLLTRDITDLLIAIEEGKTVEELLKMFKEQNHSGFSASVTRSMIMRFSKNGYPFFEATKFGEFSEKEIGFYETIIRENEMYEKSQSETNSSREHKRPGK